MTLSLILACLWAIAANVSAMFPSRRNHWPAAYWLFTVGLDDAGDDGRATAAADSGRPREQLR